MPSKITVVDWVTAEEASSKKCSFGGLGGFFEKKMRWKDYISDTIPEKRKYAEAIRKSVVTNKLKFTAPYHQSPIDKGVPLFSDDTIGFFSYRAWGDIMAAIWAEEENKNYSYMNFYM